ncbi:hypothetical protein MRX96_008433 [Rhipicephalus microplus]
MAEQSPPFSATPLERPSRSLVPTSSHRRSASVACTRVLWNLISSAKAVRLHHEQAQKLCRVVSEKPTSLRLPVLAADVETTARGLTSSAASSPTTSTTASSTAVAAHHTAQLEDAGSILCVNVTVPQNVPLPLDEEPDIADMDTTSTRKRSRPSESGSDDEGGSRKMHAVAPERATVACLTPTSNDAVAHEDAVTHATDEISQSEFQTVLSKSKKRRQRASTSQGPAAHTGPRPATESTAMLAHVAPGTSNAPTATQTAPAGVRVNTKKNIVAADASTPEWMNRLLATSELAGIPVTARLPADRSQSSGVVQGVDGDYTDEALLAAVSSDVPVIAARRQGTSLVLRFASPVPPTRVRLFRMVFEASLVTATKNSQDRYDYNVTAVVMLTELCKLFAATLLYLRDRCSQEIGKNRKVLFLYFVPALLYCFYNNLAFVNLAAFDPTTYNLLLQFRVVITGLSFQDAFVKHLGLPSKSPHAAGGKVAGIFSSLFSGHMLLLLLQVFCSCFAGVYNEFLPQGHWRQH